ncbi:putative C6 transcription factor [Xylona heveae TC161]|uniref:Putative C6 transcription factor n=1 Tax=Xylona heveae (strain CBS 132557 / TC161) TaxID=1328760 RepID=A0A165IHR0_XYLHT|nr:putative C6 transcription factor [Xylona heveae TC161]KZF24914.1 putative C6 transcription factor [Xylona heveae TC161]
MPPKRHLDTREGSHESSPKSLKKSFTACQRCHAHKIKCSGDQPCAKCQQTGFADQCRYANRDRKLKVNESYIDQLVSENQRLEEQLNLARNAQDEVGGGQPRPASNVDDSDTSTRNPLIGERAWFHPYDPSAPPIYIGEAACTAFATRFRQFLTGDKNATNHLTRTQYLTESALAAANSRPVTWPSLPQARLLVKIAFNHVGRVYHLLPRKANLEKLEEIYRTANFDCPLSTCKFFALFAFGEVYSIRSIPSSSPMVPGTPYFAKAMTLIQFVPERANLSYLENLILLSLFSYFLNRRHSAYSLIGMAMRLGLTIGLNHNVPESQLIDPVERQHRVRLWWTIYMFDRMWGSKMGLPMQVLDEDIHVDMPSTVYPQTEHDAQFLDTKYSIAGINLAQIAGEIVAKIYSRKTYHETFLQRVQKLLKSLKNWVETLPEHVKLKSQDDGPNQKHIVSLHLSFNQCVILATRPTLLHALILQTKTAASNERPAESISQAVLTLAEACIHAARHTHSLIVEEWVNGSLSMFGYFYAHYLFSSALVLAMSSLLAAKNKHDIGGFETSIEILRSMSDNGNLSAKEFYVNLEQVKLCLDSQSIQDANNGSQQRRQNNEANMLMPDRPAMPPMVVPASMQNQSMLPAPSGSQGLSLSSNTFAGFTTEMAFLEPTMQDFLAQSDMDLGLLNPVDMSTSDPGTLWTWPTPSLPTE